MKDDAAQRLKALRKQIDKIDHDLLKILKRRLALSKSVAQCKLALNIPLFQKIRWSEMLVLRSRWADRLLISASFSKEIFTLIHKESLRRQKDFKIKKQGVGS